MSDSFDVFLFN